MITFTQNYKINLIGFHGNRTCNNYNGLTFAVKWRRNFVFDICNAILS